MKTQNSPFSKLAGKSACSQLIARIAFIWLALLASVAVSRAASGVWTNDASSVWSATTNWLNGVVADGSGNTADFTMANVNTNTVTLDASHSLDVLMFGASGGATTNNWILKATNNSVLTLAGGTSTIAVSNGVVTNTAILAVPVAGTSGLTKVGGGTLALAGADTYSGGTTVSGGTLRLTNTVAGVSPSDPVLYLSFDNVAGTTVINQGSGGHAMDGTIVGSASIVSGGRYGNGLAIPAGAASASASYVLINNPVVPLNVSAPGNTWTLAMWINTTTAGGAYFYQGSGGWANANTEFYLENGTGGDGAGTHMGGVRFAQGWMSGTATVNDGNWHFIVMTVTNAVKTFYVDGAVDAFLVNQWGANGAGNQVRIGGAAGGADSQIGLGGLIDEVYMYNRALSQTEIQTLMNTSPGPTSIASAVPDNSTVSLASGATLDMNGGTAYFGSLTGGGQVFNSALANANVILTVTNDTVLNTALTNFPVNLGFAVGLTKNGAAALTIPNVMTYRGATVVNGGTLNITGSLEPIDSGGSTNTFALNKGVVNFSGAFLTNYNFNIGTLSNQTAAFYQTAGYMAQRQGGNGANFQLGSALGAYGYYYLAAGATNNINEAGIAGEGNPSGYGLADIYGTLYDGGWITMTRGAGNQTAGLPSTGILNIWPGGTVTYSGSGLQANWGSGGAQLAVINLMGGALTATNAVGVVLNQSGNAVNTGIFNLNGGVLTANGMTGLVGGRANFNGGTLVASGSGTISALATIWSGGGTINTATNPFNYTVSQKVVDPAGNGVGGISSFTGGAGYIAPPIVTVVNGTGDATGIGATAIAQIDRGAGTVTNVIITSPGVNYTATPTFVLTGGNPTSPATITGQAPTANIKGGSLTLLGSGIVTMNGGYSYTGPTFVYGGTLSVIGTNVTPSVAGNVTVSNGGLTEIIASGATWPMNNLTLLASNNITLTYGNVAANPTVPAVTLNGGVTSAPTNNITVNAFGLIPGGQFPLVKYTSGTLSDSDFANYGLLLPPGVTANLVNNKGNKSIDLFVTSAPSQIVWNGVNGASWDTTTANWTNPFTGTIVAYAEHNNGISIAGDIVTLDDTVTNNPNNSPTPLGPAPTNINVTAFLRPFPVTVNSTLPYTLAGLGSLNGNAGNTGFNALTMNNTGSLTLLTSNAFIGPVVVNGGSLIITNDSALGASNNVVTLSGGALQVNGKTTNNARAFIMPVATTIGVGSNAIAQFGGVTGGGALTKTDAGTLTLVGTATYPGTTTVNGGTLNYAGPLGISPATAAGLLTVNNAGANSIVSFSSGANVRYNTLNPLIGNSTVGNAAIYQSGGTVSGINQLQVAAVTGGSYGYYNLSGGAINMQEFDLGGFNGAAVGVFDMSGGTMTVTNWIVPSRGVGGTGILNMMGGILKFFGPAGQFQANWNASPGSGNPGTFIMNVANSSVLASNANLNSMSAGGAGKLGEINLLAGGLLQVNSLTPGSAVGTNILNFNGGTLKAVNANTAFISTREGVNVFGGGGTIDNNGVPITIPVPLWAPDGAGINTNFIHADLESPGTGYIGAPAVTISGDGFGASGYAVITNGSVAGVVITSPGTDYTGYSITFTGGGNNDATIGLYELLPDPTPNTSGGMTFTGSGVTTLTGSNTFTGPININAGTLSLSGANTYSGNVNINGGTLSMTPSTILTGTTTITNGAGMSIVQTGSSTFSLGNLTVGVSATAASAATLGLGISPANNTAVPLVNCGTLTFNGTNNISLAGAIKVGAIPLIHYAGAIGGGSGVTNVNLLLPQGATGAVSNSAAGSIVYAVITSTGPGLVWTGATTNLWDINTTTNWLLGATPTSYHQPIIPGDAVTFNDSGTGTVVLRTNAGPSSMVISNNSVTYTFGGTGSLSGPGGITKLGTGTAVMNLTNNNYTGDTTISNGTLQVGNGTALSAGGNLNLGPGATLEMNGFNETVGALSGTGIIDNNSGAANSTLTFGANGGTTWNGTVHDQGTGFGVSLTKVGNNILVIGGTNILHGGNPGLQVNAGITIVSNTAVVDTGNNEYWVQQNAGIATNILNGGTLNVGSYFVVGRNAANAIGTFIMNSGTVNKTGAGVVVIGSLGGMGTLVINGGQLLNNSDLWLGESPTAVTALYLNGGLIQADVVRENSNGGLPTANQYAYLNGGTLQATANNSNFLQQVSFEVMGGGFVLDDNGYTLSIGGNTVLLQGDGNNGGLFKKGSGTVYLDTPNQYTGLTVVTNGTLAGVGSVNGSVLVTSGGNLGSGDAGGITPGTPFTIQNNGNLTLQGNATMRISKNGGTRTQDSVSVSGNVSYGGTLTINNATSDGTPLAIGDTFQVFNVTGSKGGNFTSIVGFGATYSFDPSTGIATVLSTGPGVFTNPTGITSFQLSGANVVITGTNGQSGGAYYLLESTNVALKLNQWTSVATNVLSVNGNYTFIGTNVVAPGGLQQFYILSNTNH